MLVRLGCQAGEDGQGVKGGKGGWCGEGEQDNKGDLRVVRVAKVVRMVKVTGVLTLTGVLGWLGYRDARGNWSFRLQVKRKTAEQPHCAARKFHVALNFCGF